MAVLAVPGMPVSVSFPPGAATEAKQDAGNATLAAIQALVALSNGYVDSIEGLLAPAATAANQATANAALARLPGNFLSGVSYDYAAQVQAALTDTWTFKTGGAGGTTVKTITITYTTTDKDVISNVTAV